MREGFECNDFVAWKNTLRKKYHNYQLMFFFYVLILAVGA